MIRKILYASMLAVLLSGCNLTKEERTKHELLRSGIGEEIKGCYASQGQETQWKVKQYREDVYLVTVISLGVERAHNEQEVLFAFLYYRKTKEHQMQYAGLSSNYSKPRSILENAITTPLAVLRWCSGKKL